MDVSEDSRGDRLRLAASASRQSWNNVLWCLWLLALFTWWVRYYPLGMNVLVYDDDARQHVYWTARFQDPGLFPDDPITDFIASDIFAPWGYQMIYRLGTQVLDPLPLSHWLSLLIVVVSLWLLDRLLRSYQVDPGSRLFGGCLFLFYHTHNTVHNILGGFPRSFALPLLLAFLVLSQMGKFRHALGVIVCEVVLYPPIILNTLALAGAEVIRRWWRGRRLKQVAADMMLLVLLTVGVGMFVVSIYGVNKALSGPQVSFEQARRMAEFYPGGRSVFFQGNVLAYVLSGRSGIGVIHLSGFLLMGAVIAIGLGWRKCRVVPHLWELTWTSLLLFVLAHLLLFRLYLPSRYTFYTLSLALILFISLNLRPWGQVMQQKWPRVTRTLRMTPRLVRYAIVVCLLSLYTFAQHHYIQRLDSRLVVVDGVERKMLNFLKQLPKETLIAGHPADMDNIPLIARRKVLASSEIAHPYYLGFYNFIKGRLLDSLFLHYAKNWYDVRSLVQKYHIDAFVVNKERFQKADLKKQIFFEPFDDILKARIGGQSTFVLARPPQRLICFEDERYVVLCFTLQADMPFYPSNTTQ